MYGQTGCGKSYTLGTCVAVDSEDAGIIPRFFEDVFEATENDQNIEYIFNAYKSICVFVAYLCICCKSDWLAWINLHVIF